MGMNRRDFVKSTALASVGLLLPVGQSSLARNRLFTPVRRGTGTFEGQGGTIGWFISDDAVVLIDSQFPDSAKECLDGVKERTGRRIDLLCNSHHHGDHTAGNPTLAPHVDLIMAHRNVPDLQLAAAERRGNTDGQVYATELYDSRASRDLGSETLHFRYYGPAHTGGDSVIYFEHADVAHLGDLLFNRVPPYIDLPGGSDTASWISVLERIHDDFTDDTIFIYGHGNPSYGITGTRDDLLEARDFLTALREHVESGIAAGSSVDELLVNGLDGFDAYIMPDRPDVLHGRIRLVYQELTEGSR